MSAGGCTCLWRVNSHHSTNEKLPGSFSFVLCRGGSTACAVALARVNSGGHCVMDQRPHVCVAKRSEPRLFCELIGSLLAGRGVPGTRKKKTYTPILFSLLRTFWPLQFWATNSMMVLHRPNARLKRQCAFRLQESAVSRIGLPD